MVAPLPIVSSSGWACTSSTRARRVELVHRGDLLGVDGAVEDLGRLGQHGGLGGVREPLTHLSRPPSRVRGVRRVARILRQRRHDALEPYDDPATVPGSRHDDAQPVRAPAVLPAAQRPDPALHSRGAARVLALARRTQGRVPASRSGTDRVTCLWVLDVDTGAERLAADPRALLADHATRRGAVAAGAGAARARPEKAPAASSATPWTATTPSRPSPCPAGCGSPTSRRAARVNSRPRLP